MSSRDLEEMLAARGLKVDLSTVSRWVLKRQVKYLNNLIEQDHRLIKRRTRPGLGFFSFETAQRTLSGYETMHMLQKGTGLGAPCTNR